jgi:peptidoglycan/xylan/chitin deacetylase (PgdA/CDA1 family)
LQARGCNFQLVRRKAMWKQFLFTIVLVLTIGCVIAQATQIVLTGTASGITPTQEGRYLVSMGLFGSGKSERWEVEPHPDMGGGFVNSDVPVPLGQLNLPPGSTIIGARLIYSWGSIPDPVPVYKETTVLRVSPPPFGSLPNTDFRPRPQVFLNWINIDGVPRWFACCPPPNSLSGSIDLLAAGFGSYIKPNSSFVLGGNLQVGFRPGGVFVHGGSDADVLYFVRTTLENTLTANLTIEYTAPMPTPTPTPTPTPNLRVVLMFDDGTADQVQAVNLADRYGVKLDLFVNTGRIGTQGYLNWNDLRAFARGGHAVNSHGLAHLDLTELSAEDARHQVCTDRQNLVEAGLEPPVMFAYPFGATDPTAERIVNDCGFQIAREIGGLFCEGCRVANRLPTSKSSLGNQFRMSTPPSIKSSTTLAQLQDYVVRAEAVGGWLPLVFHHVSDDPRYDPYRVSPVTLDSFLSWLTSRAGNGTVIKTVGDVIGSTPMSDQAKFNFELGTDRWQSSEGMITDVWSSTVHALAGRRSLAVRFNGAGPDTQKVYVLGPDVPKGATITFRVWVPAGTGLSAIQPFVLQGASGGWQWTGTYMPISELQENAWNRVRVVVPADAVIPLYSLGVEFFSNSAFTGMAYVDAIDWRRKQRATKY